MKLAGDGRELPGSMPVSEARQMVLAEVEPLAVESVPLAEAAGRVNAVPVTTADDVPAFDTSSMDGFAVNTADFDLADGQDTVPQLELAVVGDSGAGSPWTAALEPGTAVTISTGAAMPPGADAVVKVEDTGPLPGGVLTPRPTPGQNVRHRGEIMAAGTQVLEAGIRIGPVETGLLAATGRDPVDCHRRPRVAIVATGDELVAPGEPRGPGQIWNSNLPVISEMVTAAGGEVVSARTVADSPEATRAALEAALEAALDSDLIAICGGVSVGDHDHVAAALSGLGVERRFWGLALRPGRPTWFGVRGRTRVLGLPGNPVSAMAVFAILGAPLIRSLSGERPAVKQGSGVLAAPVDRRGDRMLAAPCRSHRRGGRVELEPIRIKGSHDFLSLSGADALAMIESGTGSAAAGDEVPVVMLRGQ